MFDRFYRGERHRHTVDGSGLGLAIVRAVIEGHRGGVEVLNTDSGTTVRITLPNHRAGAKGIVGVDRSE